jgi:hypothetical protein
MASGCTRGDSALCICGVLVWYVLGPESGAAFLSTGDARYWTHAALLFTVIYAVFVTANYVVQLATVIPARLKGAGEAIRLLEQTPHSLFWNYDAIGYLAMGLATLVAIPALEPVGVERGVRRSFIAHTAVTPLIAVVYFAPTFSTTLLFLGFPWAVTAPLFMWMLARLLRGRTAPRGDVPPDLESTTYGRRHSE